MFKVNTGIYVFIINFEHISLLALFLLLTLGRVMQQLAQKKFMQVKLTQRMLFSVFANTQIDKKKVSWTVIKVERIVSYQV